ncbi:phage major tail protein, phi13 family [Schinkia azotoformans MEV2011]|uniref:Phage major tail protein, phi13 family n=2 Tax=Schinkia azotoformans TaxID=1454 RepID=A0A072P3U2_SCHAZ|nr:phage major tail protein, phi13 family [Schinkia azotoformans MEV2011]
MKKQEAIQYTIGVEDLHICFQLTEGDTATVPTYEEDVYAQTNITDVTITPNISNFTKYASNKKIINITKNSSYALAFNLAGLSRVVKDKMLGKTPVRGVAFTNATPTTYPKFAVGLPMPTSDGKKVLRWYPNCTITPTAETFATQNEEMTVNDVAYTITADPLLFNDVTEVELDTGREGADITADEFLAQVVYDESQLETLFPVTP